MATEKNKILLHVCCGICGLEVIRRLKSDFREVALFFYNPNIYPAEEYARRLEVIRDIAKSEGLELIEGGYEPDKWFSAVKGLENEPEGGNRCPACFAMRLGKTAKKAVETGCDWFATTLTISPRKPTAVINGIGSELAGKNGISFLEADFKKNDGFKKTMTAAREHGYYRQSYCGCVFSIRSKKDIITRQAKTQNGTIR